MEAVRGREDGDARGRSLVQFKLVITNCRTENGCSPLSEALLQMHQNFIC